MNNTSKSKIKYTTLYPTSLLVNGIDGFGYELAKSLTDQGGYVIIVDNLEKEEDFPEFAQLKNTAFLDFEGIADMMEDIRRLDYVFYLNHNTFGGDTQFSSQEFLAASSYLNQVLNLSASFDALFLLSNSIRAHKYLLSKDRFSEKYVKDETEDSSYSEAEFLRYSESLVIEYKKTKNLQAKVLRLGELLGEGIELSKNTNVGKMVWQAINGQDLYLERDGLDSEYYIHVIDAIYGVLKAQFTKDNKDFIYTLAYPEPLTQLSLAYKIQEFEIDAGDIKFIDEDDTKVRLSLPIYKPAKNLYALGWSPKVDLDSALIQSIAYSKKLKEDLEDDGKINHSNMDIGEEYNSAIQNTALQKLINERKSFEAKNKNKYSKAVAKVEDKQHLAPWGVKLRRKFIKKYDNFVKNFSFFKDITLLEFGIYSILFTLFIFIFITLLAPLTSIVRDLIFLNKNLNDATVSADIGDWEGFNSSSRKAGSRVDSLEETVNNADVLFALTGRTEFRQELLGFIQSLGFYTDSLENFSESAEGTDSFYSELGADFVYRPTNTSVLSLASQSQETSSVNVSELQSQNDIAIRLLENSQRIYSDLDKSQLPNFIQSLGDNLFSQAPGLQESMENNGRALALAQKMNRGDYTLGYVVQDNMRTNYSGGEIAALGLFEFNDGKLTAARLTPVQNTNFTLDNLNRDELSTIQNLARDINLGTDNNEAAEALGFSLLPDNYNSILQKSLSDTFSTEVDDVVSINLLAFEDLLSNYGEVELNGEKFTNGNYVQQLNLLQEDSEQTRNRLITNLAAVLMLRIFSNENQQLDARTDVLAKLFAGNKFILDDELASVLETENKYNDIFIAGYKGNVKNYTINPQIDLNIETTLSTNESENDVNINVANAEDLSEVLFCVSSIDTKFGTTQLSAEDYSILNFDKQKCIILNTTSKKNHNFSYSRSWTSKTYDGEVAFSPGIGVRYDVEVAYPANYSLSESVPTANKKQNSVFYSGESFSKFVYELKFN